MLGAQPISSFTDNDAGSQISAQLYENTYHAMLTETQWHFATRTERLPRSVFDPDNGYMAKFQLPPDLLHVVSCTDPVYEIYENELYCNSPAVMIDMVYAVDEVNLPVYFARALEYNLASLFAVPITGSTSRADYFRQIYELELKRARHADAAQRPGRQMGNDRYIEVRAV